MTDPIYPVPENIKQTALIDEQEYQRLYRWSIDEPEAFWAEQAGRIDWIKPFTQVKNTRFTKGDVDINWYQDGQLNACYNCIDRHLKDDPTRTAIIWEGDEPQWDKHISYQELHDQVCLLANGMKKLGVKKGDRVIIYMPMVPEAAYAMLACARIGAIHSVIFGGFSPNAIADRIHDCEAKVVITANVGRRGGGIIPLKQNVDKALEKDISASIENVIVFQHLEQDTEWRDGRDVWWHELIADCAMECEPEVMDAEDPLFILYTSGSTG